MTDEQTWTWRIVDPDGNVVMSSDEPIHLEMTTQLGEAFGLTKEED